jgi:hypothetical protein
LETSINIIFNYIIEALNILNSLVCFSVIFVIAFTPLPFWLALVTNTLVLAVGSISFLLISTLSILKVFYVKHFEKLFNTDPKVLGNCLLILTVLAGLIPCVVLSWVDTVSDRPRTPKGAAFLAGLKISESGLPLAVMYASGIAAICTITALFCTLYLATFPQASLTSRASLQPCEQNRIKQLEELIRTPNLKKLVLGSVMSAFVGGLSFYFNYKRTDHSGEVYHIPPPVILSPFVINLVLVYYVTDPNVVAFLRQLIHRQWQTFKGSRSHVMSATLDVVTNNSEPLNQNRALGVLALAATRSLQSANIIYPSIESKLDFTNSNSHDGAIAVSDNPRSTAFDKRPLSMEAEGLTPVDNS